MATATKAQPADDTVWLRSTSLGETRPFTPSHAEELLKLQAHHGHEDWRPTTAPQDATTPAPAAADDSATRRRPKTARKPR